MSDEESIRRRFQLISGMLDERLRRYVAAAEALAIGRGGVSIVSRATGMSRGAIQAGVTELKQPARKRTPAGRIRRPGGGRKRTVDPDPTLRSDLEKLIEPATRGDPESPLRWTCKSSRQLAAELNRQGHRTSHRMVAALLHELGYSLQANRKTIEGTSHPDRNAQFEHINRRSRSTCGQRTRSSRSTPRRRNWSGTSRMPGGNGGRRATGAGPGPRLRDPGTGAGHPVRCLRSRPEHGLGERRHRSRHGGVCRGEHSPLVAIDGAARLSSGEEAVDHGRWRRQQRFASPSVEARITETGRRDRTADLRLSLSAGNQQVEQDRASPVLLHQPELAWPTPDQPRRSSSI